MFDIVSLRVWNCEGNVPRKNNGGEYIPVCKWEVETVSEDDF